MKNYIEKIKVIIKNDILSISISVAGVIFSGIQILELKETFNNSFRFLLYNIAIIAVIISITILNFVSKRKEIKTQLYIKNLEENNKNLLEVSDDVRCFKHDFNNIMQAITGYIDVKDIDALEKYFNELMKDCHHVNIMESLNARVRDNPALYSILVEKYQKAKANNIIMNINIFINLKVFTEKNYCVSRILGILLDNAIEASIESEEKMINVLFMKEVNTNENLIEIENSYISKNIDTEKIFEKNYTTKNTAKNSGLGLWKIREIIKKDDKLILNTSKTKECFKQQLKMID